MSNFTAKDMRALTDMFSVNSTAVLDHVENIKERVLAAAMRGDASATYMHEDFFPLGNANSHTAIHSESLKRNKRLYEAVIESLQKLEFKVRATEGGLIIVSW